MSRYGKAHSDTSGPGDARPSAFQIIKDEGLEGALKDKVFIVTGASSGLGIETGRALAATGAKVFLAVRDLEKGKTACESFLEPGRVELLKLDVSKLESVRAAAATFLQKSSTLNVLVCNAGVMYIPTREPSVDGFEMHLAVNYLGHFLLFWLLKDTMIKSSTPEFQSRLVNVSSSGHHASEIIWDDFNMEKKYDPLSAYAQSKLAQIYHANYVERHFGSQGIHALSLMPGSSTTNLAQYIPKELVESIRSNPEVRKRMKDNGQGAATTVIAAVGKEWEGKGGVYLEDCAQAAPEPFMQNMRGIVPHTYDEEKENKTWDLTIKLLKLD